MILIKHFYEMLPKPAIILLSLALLLFIHSACTEPEALSSPYSKYSNVLYGQVFNLSHPGPIPIDWIPFPYETVCTVIIHDKIQGILIEAVTDNKGKFRVSVPDGTYYIQLKDSMISRVTGPFKVQYGSILEVIAYFDNGMR